MTEHDSPLVELVLTPAAAPPDGPAVLRLWVAPDAVPAAPGEADLFLHWDQVAGGGASTLTLFGLPCLPLNRPGSTRMLFRGRVRVLSRTRVVPGCGATAGGDRVVAEIVHGSAELGPVGGPGAVVEDVGNAAREFWHKDDGESIDAVVVRRGALQLEVSAPAAGEELRACRRVTFLRRLGDGGYLWELTPCTQPAGGSCTSVTPAGAVAEAVDTVQQMLATARFTAVRLAAGTANDGRVFYQTPRGQRTQEVLSPVVRLELPAAAGEPPASWVPASLRVRTGGSGPEYVFSASPATEPETRVDPGRSATWAWVVDATEFSAVLTVWEHAGAFALVGSTADAANRDRALWQYVRSAVGGETGGPAAWVQYPLATPPAEPVTTGDPRVFAGRIALADTWTFEVEPRPRPDGLGLRGVLEVAFVPQAGGYGLLGQVRLAADLTYSRLRALSPECYLYPDRLADPAGVPAHPEPAAAVRPARLAFAWVPAPLGGALNVMLRRNGTVAATVPPTRGPARVRLFRPFGRAIARPGAPAGGNAETAGRDPTRGLVEVAVEGDFGLSFPTEAAPLGSLVLHSGDGVRAGAGPLALFPWVEASWPEGMPPTPGAALPHDLYHRNLMLELGEDRRGGDPDAGADPVGATRDRFARAAADVTAATRPVENWLPGAYVAGGLPTVAFHAPGGSVRRPSAVVRHGSAKQVLTALYPGDSRGPEFLRFGVDWPAWYAPGRQPRLRLGEVPEDPGGAVVRADGSAVPLVLTPDRDGGYYSFDAAGVVRPPRADGAGGRTQWESAWLAAPGGEPRPVLRLWADDAIRLPIGRGHDVWFWCRSLVLVPDADADRADAGWFQLAPPAFAALGGLGRYCLRRATAGHTDDGHPAAWWPRVAGVPLAPAALTELRLDRVAGRVAAVRFTAAAVGPRDVDPGDPARAAGAAVRSRYRGARVTVGAADGAAPSADGRVDWAFSPADWARVGEETTPSGDAPAGLSGAISYDAAANAFVVSGVDLTASVLGEVWPVPPRATARGGTAGDVARLGDLTSYWQPGDVFGFRTGGSAPQQLDVSSNPDVPATFRVAVALTGPGQWPAIVAQTQDAAPTRLALTDAERATEESYDWAFRADIYHGYQLLPLEAGGAAAGCLVAWIEVPGDGDRLPALGWHRVAEARPATAMANLGGIALSGPRAVIRVNSAEALRVPSVQYVAWHLAGRTHTPRYAGPVTLTVSSQPWPEAGAARLAGWLTVGREWSDRMESFQGTVLLRAGPPHADGPAEVRFPRDGAEGETVYDCHPVGVGEDASGLADVVFPPVAGSDPAVLNVRPAVLERPWEGAGEDVPALVRPRVWGKPVWRVEVPVEGSIDSHVADPIAARPSPSGECLALGIHRESIHSTLVRSHYPSWRLHRWNGANYTAVPAPSAMPTLLTAVYDLRFARDGTAYVARQDVGSGVTTSLYRWDTDPGHAPQPIRGLGFVERVVPVPRPTVSGHDEAVFLTTGSKELKYVAVEAAGDGTTVGRPLAAVRLTLEVGGFPFRMEHVRYRTGEGGWLDGVVALGVHDVEVGRREVVIHLAAYLPDRRVLRVNERMSERLVAEHQFGPVAAVAAASTGSESYVVIAREVWDGSSRTSSTTVYRAEMDGDTPVLTRAFDPIDSDAIVSAASLVECAGRVVLALVENQIVPRDEPPATACAPEPGEKRVRLFDVARGGAELFAELPGGSHAPLIAWGRTEASADAAGLGVLWAGFLQGPNRMRFVLRSFELDFDRQDFAKLPADPCADADYVRPVPWRRPAAPQLTHLQGDGPRLMNPADPAAPPTKLSGGPVCGDPLERSRRGWLLAPILTAADGRAAAFRDALQLGTGAGGADVGHLRTDTLAAVGRFEPFGVLYNQTTDDRDGDDAARAASHLQTVATLGWTGAVVWRTLYPDGTVEFRFLARPAAERRTRPAARPPAPARLAATVDDADPRLALVREALAVATDPAAARYRYHPVRLHDLDGESPGRAPGDAAPRRTAPLRRADSLPADGTAGPTVYWGISAAFAALAPPSFVPAAHPAGAGFPAPPAGARVFLPRDLHAVFGPVKPGGTLYHVVHSLARPATDGPPAIAAPDTAFALRDPQRLAEPGGAEVEIVEAKYRPAELGTAPPRPLPGQKVFDVKWVERTAPYDVDSDRLPLWDPATDQPFIRLTNVEPLTYELPANRRVVATLSVVGDRVLESPQFVRMSTDAPGRVQPSAGAEVVAEVPDPGRHPRIYFVTRQANLTVPVAAVDGQGRPTGDTFAPLLRLRWTDRDGRKEDEYLLAAVLRASPVDGGVSGYYVWEFDPEGALRPDVWGTVTDVGLVWKHDSGDNDPGDTFRLSPWNEVDPYVVPFRKALPGLRPQVSLVADLAGQSPGYTHLLAYGTGAGGGPHRPRLARAAGAVRFDLTAEQAQEVEAAFPDPSGGEEVVVHVIKTLGLGEVIGHLKAATPSSAVRQGRAAPVPPKSGAPTTRRPNGRRP